ncbi:DUF2382 domain-containing protein [Embleya scabrispora]|uniref:DUF2382 domain-containing protein n=1 Tax=Embleya scabrispora TaxID=159449 RepID=UPI0003A4C62B|nr:PRC and DUF2382 domain-containing protein [Embleya scabrispora]
MKTNVTPQELIGRKVVDSEGSKIGTIGQVYLDDRTGEPEWVTVKTGMFGGRESFVPLGPADMQGDDLRVPFDKELVKEAPSLGTDEHLSPEEEARLYRHYSVTPSSGMTRTEPSQGTGTDAAGTAAAGAAGTAGAADTHRRADMSKSQLAGSDNGFEELTGKHDPSVRTNDPPSARADTPSSTTTAAGLGGTATGRHGREGMEADTKAGMRSSTTTRAAGAEMGTAKAGTDDAMTRSEERLDVHVEMVEAGRVRLRKVIETERVDKVVPVMHEEWEIIREPIDSSNRRAALEGPDMRESTRELVLHAERVVVRKDVVPVERIRLVAKKVQGEQRVTEEVRRERIELHDGDKMQVLDGKGERPDKNMNK